MYELTWITHAGELMSVCAPNFRAMLRLYGMVRACGLSARLWNRQSKGQPMLVF